MKRLQKWTLYIGYTIVVTVLFLYYLFPSEAAKSYMSGYLEERYPDYTVMVADIKPVFPPGLKFESIRIAYQGDEWGELDEIRVRPRYMSLFSKQKTVLFNMMAYSGSIQGAMDLQKAPNGYNIKAVVDLTDMRLDDMAHLQELSGRRVAGVLGSRIDYTGNTSSDGRLNVSVQIRDCEVGLTNPIFSINTIAFDKVDAELSVDRRSLKLKHCDATGNQVDGRLSGVVLFRKPFGSSRLDIKGNVMPHHLLMASLKKVMPESLLPKKKPGDKGYPLKFYGTIEKPKFSLR